MLVWWKVGLGVGYYRFWSYRMKIPLQWAVWALLRRCEADSKQQKYVRTKVVQSQISYLFAAVQSRVFIKYQYCGPSEVTSHNYIEHVIVKIQANGKLTIWWLKEYLLLRTTALQIDLVIWLDRMIWTLSSGIQLPRNSHNVTYPSPSPPPPFLLTSVVYHLPKINPEILDEMYMERLIWSSETDNFRGNGFLER